MFRRCSLVFGTVVLLLGLGGPPATASPAAKVEVCHLPPGNKANFHTITISSNALAAHLAHGDLTGACENLGEILCDDANACTYDRFATGTTVCAHAPVNCNDTNPCTTDSCNPDTGMCEATPVTSGASCADAFLCTGPGVCQTGICVASQIPGCCAEDANCKETPDNLCTTNLCIKATPAAATGTCDNNPADDVQCTPSDLCHPQACNGLTGTCEVATILGCECSPTTGAHAASVDPQSCSQFPASGQTIAYPADKNDGIAGEVAVPDDGTVQAGATLNYTDNCDGTITDNNTGLMWEKKTNLDATTNFANLHDADNAYYWTQSGVGINETIWDWLEDVNAEGGLGYAGHNDWRIPNIRELQSIVDYSRFKPMINPVFDPTVFGAIVSRHWSSTTHPNAPFGDPTAWSTLFSDGLINGDYGWKGIPHLVRAVRGGYGIPSPQCAGSQFPASGQTIAYPADKNDGIAGEVAVPDDGTVQAGATLSYNDNGDGTITDNNTGLMWEKKTNLDATTNFANLHDADNFYVWSGNGMEETIWDWLEDVNTDGGLGYAGHNDWRIPNIRELHSIVDYSIPYPGPTINPIFGPTAGTHEGTDHPYWTSTSNPEQTSFRWYVLFSNGYVHNAHWSQKNVVVRAVRGGS